MIGCAHQNSLVGILWNTGTNSKMIGKRLRRGLKVKPQSSLPPSKLKNRTLKKLIS